MILLENTSANREEWLRLRKKGLTASEYAAAAGLSPFKSAFELYCDKLDFDCCSGLIFGGKSWQSN